MKFFLLLLFAIVCIDKHTVMSTVVVECNLNTDTNIPGINVNEGQWTHVSVRENDSGDRHSLSDWRRVLCPTNQVITQIRNVEFGSGNFHHGEESPYIKDRCSWGCHGIAGCKHTIPKWVDIDDADFMTECIGQPGCYVRAHKDFLGIDDPAEGCVKSLAFDVKCAPSPTYNFVSNKDGVTNTLKCTNGKKIKVDSAAKLITSYGTDVHCFYTCSGIPTSKGTTATRTWKRNGGYMRGRSHWWLYNTISSKCDGKETCTIQTNNGRFIFNGNDVMDFGEKGQPSDCTKRLTTAWKCE